MTDSTDRRAPVVARVELFDAWHRLLAAAEATDNGHWRVLAGGRLVVADTRIGAVLSALAMAEDEHPAAPAQPPAGCGSDRDRLARAILKMAERYATATAHEAVDAVEWKINEQNTRAVDRRRAALARLVDALARR